MLFITWVTERLYGACWWEISLALFFAAMYTSWFDEAVEKRKRKGSRKNDK